MHQKRNRKMVSCDLASFPIKKECKNLMPHWCSEHQGRRSLGSEPHENRRPSVTMPAPASARDDDSGRQHTVISKEAKNDKHCTASVISTASERSGEISRPHGTASIRAVDLSALRHNRAEVPLLPYRPLPPLEMTHGQTGSPKKVIKKAPRKGELFRYFRLLRLLPFWCGSTEVQRHRPEWPRQ